MWQTSEKKVKKDATSDRLVKTDTNLWKKVKIKGENVKSDKLVKNSHKKWQTSQKNITK